MLACAESDSVSVSQFWIFENISKYQRMDPRFPGDGDIQKQTNIFGLSLREVRQVLQKMVKGKFVAQGEYCIVHYQIF